jgi:hypothetical protein
MSLPDTQPTHLPDETLLKCLRGRLADERRSMADVLRLMAEVDRRRLYAASACDSMFAYATRVLGMSESAAYRRICVARAGRRFPSIFERVQNGQHHLSGLCVLVPYLTDENQRELLDAAAGLGKRDIEQLVARRFPKADVPTSLRKQPSPGRVEASDRTAAKPEATPCAPQGSAPQLSQPKPAEPLGLPLSAPVVHRQQHPQPLSDERYLLKVTVSSRQRDKLQQAQDLLGEQDVAAVMEQALDALIAQQLKKKYAVGAKPRQTQPKQKGTSSPAVVRGASNEPKPNVAPRSRAIPAEVRRAVYARDAGQCGFVDPQTGQRCQARSHLELHHRVPFAKGGAHSVDNVMLACRTHNAHYARRDYGQARIQTAIETRRANGKYTDLLADARASTAPGEGCEPRTYRGHRSGSKRPTGAAEPVVRYRVSPSLVLAGGTTAKCGGS